VPPHLLPNVPTGERRARRLALLLDSDDQDIRDWAQAEYLKLGRAGRRLVREGVFEVRVALDGADDNNPAEDWTANENEEDLEKLKEKLEREKERLEEREEVEREMVWAREVFGKWLVDGRLDAVFRLSADVLNELLKDVARDEGEEWVAEEGVEEAAEEAAEEHVRRDSKDIQTSPGPSSMRGTSQTLVVEQAVQVRPASSVASSKRTGKRRSEPSQKADPECEDAEPKPVPAPQPVPMPPPVLAPVREPEIQAEDPEESWVLDPNPPPAPSHAEPSPEPSPLPVPVPLPVLHPSIFSEEGLLTYANNHPDPLPVPAEQILEQIRPESQHSNSNNTITPLDYQPDTTVQHDSYADFFAKDPRRRRTPLLRVKPLPSNDPLPKPEKAYDSYADFYANDPRRMTHVDDRPLPTLAKKDAKKDATKSADRSAKPQSSSKPPKLSIPSKAQPQSSSSKPPKLSIPSKAAPDPPRVTESKQRRRSHSRQRRRRDPSPSLDDFAISSSLSSGGLTTPGASVVRSRSPSPPRDREHRHSSHRKSGHKHRPSSGLTSPTPSQSGRRRDSRSRHHTPPPPLPVPAPAPAPAPKPKRSWAPFRLSGGASSASSSASTASSRQASPEPTPIMPRGPPYGKGPRPLIPTVTMASDAGAGDHEDGAGAGAVPAAEAVVPPALPLPPVQFWLPGYPAYKLDHARAGGGGDARTSPPRRHNRGEQPASPSSTRSSAQSLLLQQRPPPPVFLALGARRACVPYTPAFQGVDLRVVRPLSAREKLAMRDAVSVLVRLGARVVGAEAGGLGVRGEMWSLSYVGF
jgi:hypothetical protein